MVDGEEIRQFWAHWQHEPDTSEQFTRFRTRVDHVAEDLWNAHFKYHDAYCKRFALLAGTTYYPSATKYNENGLSRILEEAENAFQIAEALQNCLWSLEGYTFAIEDCCRRFQEVFDLSPGIMISLIHAGNDAIICPSGVKLLDKAVVESTLAWLVSYPGVRRPFAEALKLYAGKDPHQYRNMLDNLRFAAEQMLQAVLKNGKTLENQKSEFQLWLKGHGVHGNIGGMYHTLLFGYFTQYQNDAVKHHEDEYSSAELEFVLYVTGTFLRLIQRLIEEQGATKATTTTHA